MRKVSGLTMMTSGMPVVCCTQHTRPGWFMTSDHWHRAGDILLLPPLELKKAGGQERDGDIISSSSFPSHIPDPGQWQGSEETVYGIEEVLPFDVDGEKPLHVSGAAAHCGSKGLSLAVAEEKHLKHMGVIDRHTTAGYLSVAILKSHRKNLPQYCFLPFSIFKKPQTLVDFMFTHHFKSNIPKNDSRTAL